VTSYLVPTLVVFTLLVSPGCGQEKPDLKDSRQRISYAVGADIAASLKRQEIDIDPKALVAGFSEGFAGKAALNETELQNALEELRTTMAARIEARQKVAGEKNLKAGAEFLAANAKKDGIMTTASGLQYRVMKSGTGPSPKNTDIVEVHYHGTLIDGTVFDSSVSRGEPVTFAVDQVIPGWVEALQLMKVGDQWQLFVPAALAYGERSPGGSIGPNSTLIFEVELLSIEKPDQAP
jgi:FKBP-type peptidyl-prolyl cis-trans isomerase